jgi:glycosyltransferase involved in cell wall biosynthesis
MRFSIIMPTMGDRPDFLALSIKAILDQSFSDFELIIQNGGTHFDIPNDKRIRYVEEKDSGIADAMNRGMSKARGQIFCEANDDDFLRKNALAIVNKEIKDYKWCYGLIMFGDQLYGSTWDYTKLKTYNYIGQPAVFWKRTIFEELGGQDSTAQLAADYEYMLRMGSIYEPKFIETVLADYSVHPGQITAMRLHEQMADALKVKSKYQ